VKELVIISGKGGTGKTSIVGAFAYLAKKKVLCDADVDAADLHLLTEPSIRKRQEFRSGHRAVIDPEKCTGCGRCRELCRFDAVREDFRIDPIDCEGCGVCVAFCPEKAISFPENVCGEWFISDTRVGPMVHARLGIAEENSGKLVTLVRKEARLLAEGKGFDLLLTDGPPGVGCPVIASLGGASAVLIVTEPTVSGWHDMERVADLAGHFKIPAMVCVNKFDLNPEIAQAVEHFAEKKGLRVLSRIPFDPGFTKSMVQGKTIIEYDEKAPGSLAVKRLWKSIEDAFQ